MHKKIRVGRLLRECPGVTSLALWHNTDDNRFDTTEQEEESIIGTETANKGRAAHRIYNQHTAREKVEIEEK